ncbi:hypothetical protein H2199_004611 [Coniosporium tulheliwenetii]|uniref:Uncharacterized protein n=1 Tax=Coniosporium tulheliwenetii TaxID=3383036 RepID=A0ACC2Z5T1_9PEZI|nr:hypothetical protein H2199_004611 [Cladosporium sp. JES 115]
MASQAHAFATAGPSAQPRQLMVPPAAAPQVRTIPSSSTAQIYGFYTEHDLPWAIHYIEQPRLPVPTSSGPLRINGAVQFSQRGDQANPEVLQHYPANPIGFINPRIQGWELAVLVAQGFDMDIIVSHTRANNVSDELMKKRFWMRELRFREKYGILKQLGERATPTNLEDIVPCEHSNFIYNTWFTVDLATSTMYQPQPEGGVPRTRYPLPQPRNPSARMAKIWMRRMRGLPVPSVATAQQPAAAQPGPAILTNQPVIPNIGVGALSPLAASLPVASQVSTLAPSASSSHTITSLNGHPRQQPVTQGDLRSRTLASRPVPSIGAAQHQDGYYDPENTATQVQLAITGHLSQKRARDDDQDSDDGFAERLRNRRRADISNLAPVQYDVQHQDAPPHLSPAGPRSVEMPQEDAVTRMHPIQTAPSGVCRGLYGHYHQYEVGPATQDELPSVITFPPGSTDRYAMPEPDTWVPYPTLRYVTALIEEEANRRREPTEEELAAYTHAMLNDLWRGSDLWK